MAHCNTILLQILKFVPRHEFETLAKQHHSGRVFRKATRWSQFVTITEGKKHDVTVGRMLNFPKGSIVAIDKAYNDYAWYKQFTDKEIFFVTRLKTNAQYRIIERRPMLKGKGLTCDQTIKLPVLRFPKSVRFNCGELVTETRRRVRNISL